MSMTDRRGSAHATQWQAGKQGTRPGGEVGRSCMEVCGDLAFALPARLKPSVPGCSPPPLVACSTAPHISSSQLSPSISRCARADHVCAQRWARPAACWPHEKISRLGFQLFIGLQALVTAAASELWRPLLEGPWVVHLGQVARRSAAYGVGLVVAHTGVAMRPGLRSMQASQHQHAAEPGVSKT